MTWTVITVYLSVSPEDRQHAGWVADGRQDLCECPESGCELEGGIGPMNPRSVRDAHRPGPQQGEAEAPWAPDSLGQPQGHLLWSQWAALGDPKPLRLPTRPGLLPQDFRPASFEGIWCARWGPRERRALFLQATPHPDLSRRLASFRFQLREDGRPELPPQARSLGADAACRPCSDAELLLAVCTSDFVIYGTILGVAHDAELQESVITVAAARVLRQTLPVFRVGDPGGQGQASIRTPLHCGVRPGPGTFLFMGWNRFGEAWLGCAPRLQEFSRAYAAAHADHLHPCEVVLD
nr:PREDICTED: meteorin [Bos mutus]